MKRSAEETKQLAKALVKAGHNVTSRMLDENPATAPYPSPQNGTYACTLQNPISTDAESYAFAARRAGRSFCTWPPPSRASMAFCVSVWSSRQR